MGHRVVGIGARICIGLYRSFAVWTYVYRSGVLMWDVVCVTALVGV